MDSIDVSNRQPHTDVLPAAKGLNIRSCLNIRETGIEKDKQRVNKTSVQSSRNQGTECVKRYCREDRI